MSSARISRRPSKTCRKRPQATPVPLTIPIGSGSTKDSDTPFIGIIDLIDMAALYFEPSDQGKTYRAEPLTEDQHLLAVEWRERMFDALTKFDDKDKLTSAYLEGKEIPVATVRGVIRELTLAGHIQPVFAGSGREHIGIQPLLDAVTYYLPSPLDRPAVTGINPRKDDKEEKRKPEPREPFCGLVFKIVADTHGELYYVRIYSGTVKANSKALNPRTNTKEMVTKLYHTKADPSDRQELPEASAGDIVAIIGPKESITGDTLCDAQHPLLAERIQFAQAVLSRSIEPESSADKDKLTSILNVLKKEDPTFTWTIDKDTGQTLMNGMGMLHLEIKQHRMDRDFRLKIRVGKPRVSYRETLKQAVKVQGECVKQTGGAGGGLFAKVTVELEPYKGEESVSVSSRLKPRRIADPGAPAAAAEQGVRGALESGELGYPVMHVKATIVGGEMDEQLSNDVAFQAAGADAVRKAMRDNMVLLEPWMKVLVEVPAGYVGSVISDVGARKGEVTNVEADEFRRRGAVTAYVPLRNLFDYADAVRSLSQGRAASTMEPHEYKPAPDEVLHRLLHPEDFY